MMMKIIVVGVWAILMLGTIATSNESRPERMEHSHLSALQKISNDLDKISVEKSNHHQKMKNGIARRFQSILQSDKEHHELLKASLQIILDDSVDLPSFGNAHTELINNISRKIGYSRENDKEIIQILENETSAQMDALNKKRSEQENELKAMVLKIFTAFSVPLEDCSELIGFGARTSGIYQIKPKGMDFSVPAYCDMETDGGGWTVIQRRGDFGPAVNFRRQWEDYKKGFGNLAGEFWLGNNIIYYLTRSEKFQLKIDMKDYKNVSSYVTFPQFYIHPESDNYIVQFGGIPIGQPGDTMTISSGYFFSTPDRVDRCRIYNQNGPWWFREECPQSANLNGIRQNSGGMSYMTFDGSTPIAEVTMKVKPANL